MRSQKLEATSHSSGMISATILPSSIAEIIPELWLMDRHNVQLRAPYGEEFKGGLAVLVAES